MPAASSDVERLQQDRTDQPHEARQAEQVHPMFLQGQHQLPVEFVAVGELLVGQQHRRNTRRLRALQRLRAGDVADDHRDFGGDAARGAPVQDGLQI